jgi:hypothetical protein
MGIYLPDTRVEISSDRNRLTQVMVNLISNSIKPYEAANQKYRKSLVFYRWESELNKRPNPLQENIFPPRIMACQNMASVFAFSRICSVIMKPLLYSMTGSSGSHLICDMGHIHYKKGIDGLGHLGKS